MAKSDVNTAIILAGGKNTRMGGDKAFLKIGEKTIIEIILDKLKSFFEKIIIVTNSPDRYRIFRVRLISDIIPNKGPLGGIYSGLVNTREFHNFFFACDTPFLNVELIRYMKNNYGNFDVITPKLKYGYEALHAIYSKNCITPIEKQLKQNNLKIIDFFPQVKIKEITEDIIKQFDPRLLSFFNINTNADYQQALNIAPSLRT